MEMRDTDDVLDETKLHVFYSDNEILAKQLESLLTTLARNAGISLQTNDEDLFLRRIRPAVTSYLLNNSFYDLKEKIRSQLNAWREIADKSQKFVTSDLTEWKKKATSIFETNSLIEGIEALESLTHQVQETSSVIKKIQKLFLLSGELSALVHLEKKQTSPVSHEILIAGAVGLAVTGIIFIYRGLLAAGAFIPFVIISLFLLRPVNQPSVLQPVKMFRMTSFAMMHQYRKLPLLTIDTAAAKLKYGNTVSNDTFGKALLLRILLYGYFEFNMSMTNGFMPEILKVFVTSAKDHKVSGMLHQVSYSHTLIEKLKKEISTEYSPSFEAYFNEIGFISTSQKK